MKPDFLPTYREAFSSIEGAFQFDAALLFMAYNQLINAQGIGGDVLEIGVRNGLSSIAVAALRAPGGRFWAIDLFDSVAEQSDVRGGLGNKDAFINNLTAFYDDIDFITMIEGNSADLTPADLAS